MIAPLPLIGLPRGQITDLIAGQSWSPEDLCTAVAQRAAILAQQPGARGGHFALLHANSLNFFADLFAVWSVGGVAACLNPGLTGTEQVNIFNTLDPVAVLLDGTDCADTTAPVLDLATAPAPTPAPLSPVHRLDDPALILFTSGTTGAPKGVTLTHRALLARLSLNRARIGDATLARSLCLLPTHFGHGLIGNALTPMAAGGDLFLMPEAGLSGARSLGQTIDTHRISFLSSVPSYWKLALRIADAPRPGTLKRLHMGSAPLSAELWQEVLRWSGQAECVNTYGITETANWIAGASSRTHGPADGRVGHPWGGQIAVQTADGLRTSGEGEVMVQTPSLMSHYLHRPDLTDDVLQGGWYRTGDMGHLDPETGLHITGRVKHMINRGGVKLYPEEFDLLAERHENVAEACCFAIPDPVSGEAMAMAIAPKPDQTIDKEPFLSWLKSQTRPEAWPAQLHILDTIPKTARGKMNRADVAAHCARLEDRP